MVSRVSLVYLLLLLLGLTNISFSYLVTSKVYLDYKSKLIIVYTYYGIYSLEVL